MKKLHSAEIGTKLAKRGRVMSSPEQIWNEHIIDPEAQEMLNDANKFLTAIQASKDQPRADNFDPEYSSQEGMNKALNYMIKSTLSKNTQYKAKEKGLFKSKRIVFALKGGYPLL